MKLTSVKVHKYKCFEKSQQFDVDEQVTVLVGLNESGKTSALEAVAKSNYFDDDVAFKFSLTHDYPRKEKKKLEKSGVDPEAVTCTYSLSDEFLENVNSALGIPAFKTKAITVTKKYGGGRTFGGISIDQNTVLKSVHKSLPKLLENAKTQAEVDRVKESTEDEDIKDAIDTVRPFYENKWDWDHAISEYVARVWVSAHLPKFLYYDEYYTLPSRISIEKLQSSQLESEELKTAKALFELSDINVDELIKSDDFEDFKAELEATEATITEELFQYWSTNRNLEIQFDIDKIEQQINAQQKRIVEHVLDIRVRNTRAKVSLPLKNRSKGFNWFFSFLVWFKKVQEDRTSKYIILLDEPGLNLHAAAQKDLLEFLESLTTDYQIIYTTHSPFMVDPEHLHRVRTVLETEAGSVISESVLEKDPNTLFPLQAALGYDIAQNLYISKKNLLVEGISDLVYLEVISSHLDQLGRESLSHDVTVVPVGGLEKVATFVSLLRGSDLNIVCLLDSTIGQSEKSKLERLISDKIIKDQKVLHYRGAIDGASEADVEDLFELNDYLNLFNGAFKEHADVTITDLSKHSDDRIIPKLNKQLGARRFNHYRPANYLAKTINGEVGLSEQTLDRFEALFKTINVAMKK